MRAGDGAAHPLGIVDDRLALRDQLVDERADADLVVGIGPLERRDLAAHQRLELAGPGERPLDAVADRRDLAPYHLRHRGDGVGREAFGLDEAHRHLADGAGDLLHLHRAHRQHGGDMEQDQRREERDRGDEKLHRAQRRDEGLKAALDLRRHEPGDRAEPQRRGERRQDVGPARRPALQRLQDRPDALTVVVRDGGAIRADDLGGPRRRRSGRLGGRFGGREDDPLPFERPPRRLGKRTRFGDIRQARLAFLLAPRLAPRRRIEAQGFLDRRESRLGRVFALGFRRH